MSRKTLANRLDLGMTRIAGYTLFDEATKEFQETTPREVKELIARGEVNGLILVDGEIELDTEGFNIRNLMVKSAVGKFRPLYPTNSMVNCMYAAVRVIETDNGILYEVVSNKCARVKVTPEHLKMIMEIGYVAGVMLGANGEIEICKGVTIEDKRDKFQQVEKSLQAVDEKVEQSLNSGDLEAGQALQPDNNTDLKGLHRVSDSEAEIKLSKTESDESTTVTTEQSSLDIIFDSVDVKDISSDVSTTYDNTNKNKEKDPTPEQVEEKKKVGNRKTKKKL